MGEQGKVHLSTVFGEVSQKVYQRVGPMAFSNLGEQGLLNEAARVAVKKRNKLVSRLKMS